MKVNLSKSLKSVLSVYEKPLGTNLTNTPFFGERVISLKSSSMSPISVLTPGTNRYLCRIEAKMSLISKIPNLFPGQTLGPTPNG